MTLGERTSHPPGAFSWAELHTSDAAGAKAFYSGLLGWQLEDHAAGEGRTYTIALVGGKDVAAMAEQGGGEEGVPPHWNSYVTVESADDTATRAGELGGTVAIGPFDVMTLGRMAVLQDPTGAFFSVWEPRESIGATRVNDPGCLTWNDLGTTDPEAAERFYSGLFGWGFQRVAEDFDYWTIANGDRPNGGMRKQDDEEVAAGAPPNWMPYFTVEGAEAAVERVGELGGATIVPPRSVPAGTFAVVQDPQGAVFALFEGEFDD